MSETVSLKMRDAMPVRTLVLTVREGVDAGARFEGEEATIGTARDNDLVLKDETVSGYHVRLSALKDGVQVSDFGSTNGTFAGAVRVEKGIISPGSTLVLGRTSITVDAGRPTTVELHDEDRLGSLRGATPGMRRLMKDLRRVAQSNVAVLLIGESGTGKELLARGIHESSARAAKPFVTIDCGSLTPSLVQSELFGYEQGAFTGATRMKRGAFEHAHGGTVFLDEIGELPADLQTMLLGALERRRFCRVGGHDEIEVDVRVVAATNRDLRTEVNNGTFRLDLYYRLAVVTLEVPPLRERPTDVPLLVEHFIREEGLTGDIAEIIPEATMQALVRYRWPGNVRELRNYVQATIAMGEPAVLRDSEPEAVTDDELERAFRRLLDMPYAEARGALLSSFEARYVKHLVAKTHGNVARAAREAEMARSHLNLLLKRHGVRADG